MKKILAKIFTFIICSAVSAGTVVNFSSQEKSAKTIPEIQAERKANEEKIAEFEKQISELGENMSDEQAFQQTLSEQISLIQENITLLNQELEKLNSDIQKANDNIEFLDYSISERQKEIEESIELFKKRLCAMYISGNNDSMISVLLGSSSFYDMMTRVKVVNNMAEYDEQLINEILGDINSLEKDRKDLETEKNSLEVKLSEQEQKKTEKTAEIQSLNDKVAQSQAIVEQINAQQNKIQNSKQDAEMLRADFDRQEQEIQEEIRRKAEEAQRIYEEQQRRKQEEELRRKQEELIRQQHEEQKRLELEEEERRKQQEQERLYQQWLEQQVPQTESVQPVIPPPESQPYIWPVPDYYYITSYYGEREGLQHRGIDIGNADINGADVCAVRDGIVISVNNSCEHNYGKEEGSCGCGGDFGNYVIISHDGTYSTIYAHMAYVTVSVGDYVQQRQKIGAVGSTGWSTGPHLHFELRADSTDINPLDYISP
ncbi:MAG: peptidoglycan DD-metalloendopeptidase family protein [Prevotella sp.]|nr:peptidoglycan DD-metalloendopeptidase family protein [Alistipes senegalensis]MCM1357652.1 peptidoglycan DD-metalloendopeptidase family protein [Prevotella sp.]MCM1473222.1 peptidoglycan DD-metalloendopeptidase family protein [Muribaculaceae bacterium]